MEKVIVTIKLQGHPDQYDLEIPADIPISTLIKELKKFLSLKRNIYATPNYLIKIESQSKFLEQDETLAEAGVWDGSILTLMEC